MLADRLRSECAEAAQRGERSRTHDVLLGVIEGNENGPGLIARVSDNVTLISLDPYWEPISADGSGEHGHTGTAGTANAG